MKFEIKLLIIIFNFIAVGYSKSSDRGGCLFDGHIAGCSLIIVGKDVTVTITINHCHSPIDVTFIVKVPSQKLAWQYTYVSSNKAENRHVTTISNKTISLFAVVTFDSSKKLTVKAHFNLGTYALHYFMDTVEEMPSSLNCSQSKLATGYVIIGVMISILAVCGFGIFLVCYNQGKTPVSNDEIALVDHIEVGKPSELATYVDSTTVSTVSTSDLQPSDSLNFDENAAGQTQDA